MEKRLIKIVRKKIGTEPSSLGISVGLPENIKKTFNGKERMWVESHINDEGKLKVVREIIEYDPSNIYLYMNWGKLTFYFNTKSKSNVEFLANKIYNEIKNKS
jgi:hypothetical protein